MDRIYRLMKDKKEEELKRMVEEGAYYADFVRIFRLLEDQSLEELIEEHEKRGRGGKTSEGSEKSAGHGAGGRGETDGGITVSDLNYRFRKALKEPKRIFEAHQPYKKSKKTPRR